MLIRVYQHKALTPIFYQRVFSENRRPDPVLIFRELHWGCPTAVWALEHTQSSQVCAWNKQLLWVPFIFGSIVIFRCVCVSLCVHVYIWIFYTNPRMCIKMMMKQRNQHLLHENESRVCQEWFLLKMPHLSLSESHPSANLSPRTENLMPNASFSAQKWMRKNLTGKMRAAAGSGTEAPWMAFTSLLLWFAHRTLEDSGT